MRILGKRDKLFNYSKGNVYMIPDKIAVDNVP